MQMKLVILPSGNPDFPIRIECRMEDTLIEVYEVKSFTNSTLRMMYDQIGVEPVMQHRGRRKA